MRFKVSGGSDFTPVPAGNHVAICNAIVDLGFQPGSAQYPEPKHQIYVRFELPTERIHFGKDGEQKEGPMSIGRTFTASMHEKASLRKFIESWFGKTFPSDEKAGDFDLSALLDKKCLLNVTHVERGERTFANITGAAPIPKGMKSDYKRENQAMFFDLENPDEDQFLQLPEWLMEKINKRIEQKPNAKPKPSPAEATADFDDEIPF
jgi:hypothetical protein